MTLDTWTNFRIALDAARERERALQKELLEERERAKALEIIVDALADSIGRLGLNRRRFKRLIVRAGEEAPDVGPGAVRHAVFLSQARKVLGVGQTPPTA